VKTSYYRNLDVELQYEEDALSEPAIGRLLVSKVEAMAKAISPGEVAEIVCLLNEATGKLGLAFTNGKWMSEALDGFLPKGEIIFGKKIGVIISPFTGKRVLPEIHPYIKSTYSHEVDMAQKLVMGVPVAWTHGLERRGEIKVHMYIDPITRIVMAKTSDDFGRTLFEGPAELNKVCWEISEVISFIARLVRGVLPDLDLKP
jgi:hypothetical protein